MTRVLGMTLLTFVPVVLLALFAPRLIENNAFLVVGLGELGFLQAYSKRLVEMKRASGPIPYRLRVPFLPFAAGMLGYLAITPGAFPLKAAPALAITAAGLIAISKLWLAQSPLWPYSNQSAAG